MMYLLLKTSEVTPKLINTIRFFIEVDFVTIGLLDDNNSKDKMSYEDRLFVLNGLVICDPVDVDIVCQDKLDPTENLIKYKCKSMAVYGDWEEYEIEALKKLGLTRLEVKFKPKK